MALTPEQVKEIAGALHQAEHSREPMAPLTDQYPSIDIADAYAIQLEGVQERLEKHGGRIVGWKVGLTSTAMQQMFNVDHPDFGHLLDFMRLDEGGEVDPAAMIWPRVEPEVAFQLQSDLQGPDVTADQVIAATEFLIPRWRSSTAGSKTGGSSCATRSPTTPPVPISCSGGSAHRSKD